MEKYGETVTVSHEKHSRVLIDGLWNFLVSKYRVEDVALGGAVLRAHQLVVDVFLQPERQLGSLTVSNEQRSLLEVMLEFMYKGTVAVERDRLEGLLSLAKEVDFKLLVDAVSTSCSRQCKTKTTGDLGIPEFGSCVKNGDSDTGSGSKQLHRRRPAAMEPWEPEIQINEDCDVPAKKTRSSTRPPWEPEVEIVAENSVKKTITGRRLPGSLSSVVAIRCKKSAHKRAPISKFKCPECQFESSNASVVHSHQTVVHSGKKQFKCEQCDFVTSWKFVLTRHAFKLHPFPSQYFCSICKQRFVSGTELDDHLATHAEVGTFRCPHCEQAYTQNKFLVAHIDRVHASHDAISGFVCDVCQKSFKSRRELDSHLLVHTQEKPLKCPHCDKRFNFASNRTSHVSRKHKAEFNARRFTCKTCGKLLESRQTLVEHQRTHSQERPFKCPHCDKCFKSEIVAKEHVDKVHAAQGAGHLPHGCPHCERRFNHPFKLRRHLKRNHDGNFPCENCGKMLGSHLDLVAHQRTHNGDLRIACAECDKRFSDTSNMKIHVARVHRQGPDRFACDFCFEEFKSSAEMVRHRTTHLQQKAHKCPQCDKCFNFKFGLKKHTERSHGPAANKNKVPAASVSCVCEVCGRLCRSRKALRSHQQSHADRQKKPDTNKFKCPQCDYAADSQGRLTVHLEVVHAVGPARFTCETCGKRCDSRVNLERHTRTHTKEKPFKCELCPCTFAVKSGLRQHKDTVHRMGKFCCETCDRTFPCAGQLKKHQRSHTKEKPFQCPHCDLRVSQRDNLTRHINVVHGNEKYSCETCGKSLSSALQLSRHRSTHNKDRSANSGPGRTGCGRGPSSGGSSIPHHACDVCGDCFSSEEHLAGHRVTHATESPFNFLRIHSMLDS